ncbi:putative methyltransferase-domain-containing protein [Phlyctochytrium arcticum]|nr:putative methyltransferase-domain-containing protein [Phlyctochytrium arcticum]
MMTGSASTHIQITKTSDRDHLYHHVSLPPHNLTIAAQRDGTVSDSEDEDMVDPYLFDPSYTLAAATGFSVWEGAVALLSFLHKSDCDHAEEFRRRVVDKREKVIELGSGTGIGGLGIAVLGADVMCTDVESVCDITNSNIARNRDQKAESRASGWVGSTPVGNGTATAQALDWTSPLNSQRSPNDPLSATIIVAAETAWLAELAPHFVSMVSQLLETEETPGMNKVCYWAYKERGTEESKIFTTMSNIKDAFEKSGCEVIQIWKQISVEDQDKHVIVNTVRYRGIDRDP